MGNERYIYPNEGEKGFRLILPYKLYEAIKHQIVSIPGAKFVRAERPYWFIPAIQGNDVLIKKLVSDHGFVFQDGAEDVLDSFTNDPPLNPRIAMFQDGVLHLEFPKGDAILGKVQKLKKRAFIYNPVPHWEVPLILDNADDLLALLPEFRIADKATANAIRGLQDLWNEQPKGMRVSVEGKNIFIELPPKSPLEAEVLRLTGANRIEKWKWQIPAMPDTISKIAVMADKVGNSLDSLIMAQLQDSLQLYHDTVAASSIHDSDIIFHGIQGTPRPFQKAGVKYAMEHKRTIIGDQQGLGKTVQGMIWFHALGALPVVIVCPPSLVSNWFEEIRKWLPQYTVSILKGNKPKPADYDANIIICSYAIVHARCKNGMIEELQKRNFKAVVCDESHYLKNGDKDKYKKYKTKRVQAVYDLVQPVEYRLLLTGTPITNKPIEFAPQLDILGILEDFGGYWRFSREFGGAVRTAFGWQFGPVRPEKLHELNQLLRSRCYVRREKKDVLNELPAKQRTVISFDLANKDEYIQAERDIVDYVVSLVAEDEFFRQSISVYDEDTQKQLIKDRQRDKANSAARAETLVRINVLKQLATRGKMDAVVEWLTNFCESGEKIIVFAHHRWVQKELMDRFPDAARLIADDISEVQQLNKKRFMTDPNCLMIICSDEVGREGHTLTAASDVAFVELAWTPTAHEQCEDRAHRIGQTNSVTAWYLLANSSIDQDIYALIESKRTMVEAATNGSLDGMEDSSMIKDLLKKLKAKYQ